jgi:hypothetical protein
VAVITGVAVNVGVGVTVTTGVVVSVGVGVIVGVAVTVSVGTTVAVGVVTTVGVGEGTTVCVGVGEKTPSVGVATTDWDARLTGAPWAAKRMHNIDTRKQRRTISPADVPPHPVERASPLLPVCCVIRSLVPIPTDHHSRAEDTEPA